MRNTREHTQLLNTMRLSFYDFCAESGNENLLREWDAELNGDLTPQAVSHGSTREVWWRCQKGHSWKKKRRLRQNGGKRLPLLRRTPRYTGLQ